MYNKVANYVYCYSLYYFIIITIAHFDTITLIRYYLLILARECSDVLNTKKPFKVCTLMKKKAKHSR